MFSLLSLRNSHFMDRMRQVRLQAAKKGQLMGVRQSIGEVLAEGAPRFYVSSEFAQRRLGEMERDGGRLRRLPECSTPLARQKQLLWKALSEIFRRRRLRFPSETLPAAADLAAASPAPSFFLTPLYAEKLYYRILASDPSEAKREDEFLDRCRREVAWVWLVASSAADSSTSATTSAKTGSAARAVCASRHLPLPPPRRHRRRPHSSPASNL